MTAARKPYDVRYQRRDLCCDEGVNKTISVFCSVFLNFVCQILIPELLRNASNITSDEHKSS